MNKHYCCADLHGVYEAWQQIKNILDETDTLYFLGDAADRGPDSWKIITEMLADPRVVYLKGNHEDMFVNAILGSYDDERLWMHNGGQVTLQSWAIETNKDKSWIYKLEALPDHIEIDLNNKHFILSHAGCDPIDEYPDWIWDREHFISNWPSDPKYENTFIIHGHTPTPLLPVGIVDRDCEIKNSVRYAGGHKIDIDLGGVWTGYFCLLDLDTMEETIIDLNNESDDYIC